MKVLTLEDTQLLNSLIESELKLIETGFSVSSFVGKIFLQNTITSFKENYLESVYGKIIPALSTEYRYFIIGILKNIRDEYKELAISEVIVPAIGRVNTDTLLKCLSQDKKD